MPNIHLIFKTHLDVGFTDYASVVTRQYFQHHIPAALRLARQMRDCERPERFIWTTGSWLIYEYLEQADNLERSEMEAAIALGEICWHALPFTTHTELMDPELFRFGLTLSSRLDQRFGKKTIAAKMTDVPGHTRGIVPLLAEAGVTFLHIGVNPASTVPSVPPLFRWQDENGAELIVMIESGYGDAFAINGLEEALAFAHTGDNLGPQTPSQVLDVYRETRQKFQGAHVFASTLDAFALKLEPIRQSLPVIHQEIGDTWIHGVGSDPIKVAQFRELLRLRGKWLRTGRVDYEDPRFDNFNRFLLLVPEHTWGMDEKTFLGDHENYSREKFNAIRNFPVFKKFESSWVEKRGNIQKAVQALEESPLALEAADNLLALRPLKPDLSTWLRIEEDFFKIENEFLSVGFSCTNPALLSLKSVKTGRVWADEQHPLSEMSYQTFSAADYERFFDQYIIHKEQNGEWPREDFCKPGLELANPSSRTWAAIPEFWYERKNESRQEILTCLTFDKEAREQYGAPGEATLLYSFPHGRPELLIELQWFKKSACRMPEAIWLSFIPLLPPGAEWRMEKLGKYISPFEVVENGNRHLHAVGEAVELIHPRGFLRIRSADSPLVAPGRPSILDFNNLLAKPEDGMHFCLLNNVWGTNFPMWFEEDCRFRFKLSLEEI